MAIGPIASTATARAWRRVPRVVSALEATSAFTPDPPFHGLLDRRAPRLSRD
jgi:hypothetical protein